MAAGHSSLLFFASLVVLLVPLRAVDIENLGQLQGDLEDIINLHSGKEGRNVLQRGTGDPQQAEEPSWPTDCSEVPADSPSGVYVIQPKGLQPIVVYCEMNVTDGGWTVIQKNRHSTQVTWDESWSTYRNGLGNVHTEYWLGTEYIHQISQQKVYQVRFVIYDSTDSFRFADYNLFSVEDESHGYRLRLGAYSGTAGDAMTSNSASEVHDNMMFSTKDRDQDTYRRNCASSYEGGWWYSACYAARLNLKGGLTWGSLCKGTCKASAILIKPALYC